MLNRRNVVQAWKNNQIHNSKITRSLTTTRIEATEEILLKLQRIRIIHTVIVIHQDDQVYGIDIEQNYDIYYFK